MSMDSEVELVSTSYGKSGVKILYIRRDAASDDITEYEVSTLLQLNSTEDYTVGDNRKVVPTDTQKNTVFAIAQKLGVGCPEEFALNLCKHFLSLYSHIVSAKVRVETVNGWKRIQKNGQSHKHAFISSPDCTRYAEVFQRRAEEPRVTAGMDGLRVLKTTKSAFVDFHRCQYTTLPDTNDRVMSTIVTARWDYSTIQGFDFTQAWNTVVDTIVDVFAGPPDTGVFSPSVQLTMYNTQKMVLAKIRQISEIELAYPNVHYFDFDMEKFKDPTLRSTKNVYIPTDKPSGMIKATLKRRQMSKL